MVVVVVVVYASFLIGTVFGNDTCSFGGTLREFLILEYASSLISHHR